MSVKFNSRIKILTSNRINYGGKINYTKKNNRINCTYPESILVYLKAEPNINIHLIN